MKFPTRYTPPASPKIDFSDSLSMTQQHFKDECDINNIVKNYQQTGVLPQRTDALYGDFSGIPDNPIDFKRVLDEAYDNFMKLPSDFRKELDNDPAKFLDFISREENKDRCIQLGIFNKPVEKQDNKSVEKQDNSPVPPVKTDVSENKN